MIATLISICRLSWCKHPPSPFRSAAAPVGLFILAVVVAGCQGFNPADLTPMPQSTSTPAIPAIRRVTLVPGSTPASAHTPVPVSTLDVDASDLQGVSIRFWRARSDQFGSAGEDALQSLVNEFNRSNDWGISVDTVFFDDYADIFEELQTSLSGSRPDVLVGYNYQAARSDSSGRFLVDLNAYVQDPLWGFSPEETQDFYPVFWQQDLIGSKRVGIPFYRSTQVLFYNLTWASELGFDRPPSTSQAFKQQACSAARENRYGEYPGTGGWVINTDAPALLSWMYAFGAEVVHPDGKGYTFDSSQSAEAMAFLRELFDEGCAWIAANRYPNEEFASRRALMITGSLAGLQFQEEAFREAGSRDRWTVIPFPGIEGQRAITVYGPSLMVVRSTPEKQLAGWLFSRWLSAPQNQARLIQSFGTYPTRASAGDFLEAYKGSHSHWEAALELLPYARGEPQYASWRIVRWAVSDAGSFLFSPVFAASQAPALLEELDNTAAELHNLFVSEP